MVKPELIQGDIPSTKEAYSTLFKLAGPSIAEMLLTSLIGMIDTVMVSGLGSAAIAAVGLTSQPRMLCLSLFMALNIGLTAVVARRKGEERRDDANRTLNSAITVILGLAVIITALAVIFAGPIMLFAGAIKGETLELASTYFRIIIAVVPLNALTMAINASQRGIGQTKITMYVNMIANIVNVIFNFLLIEGRFGFPRLEIAGAAIASAIGVCVGFVVCILSITVRKNGYLKLNLKYVIKPDKEALAPMIKVGSNAILEQMAIRIGFFLFARMVASLGTDNMAAHQIVGQFTTISFTVGDGIGVAGTSLVGQNLGRKRADISLIYGKVAQRSAVVAGILMGIFFFSTRYLLVSMFTEEAHIAKLAADAMIVASILLFAQTANAVLAGCLRGSGDTKYVAMIMLISIAFTRPVSAFLAIYVFKWGLVGAWTATLFEICVRMCMLYTRFASFKWATIKV